MIDVRNGLEIYREHPARVSWKIPCFFTNDWCALRLAQYCEEMGVERPFDLAYGTPQCAWAGGRPSAYTQQITEDELERYYNAYDHFGIEIALTLTRLDVDKKMRKDPLCNMLLDVAERHHGWAIVANEALAYHIRQSHPGIRLIASWDRTVTTLAPKGFADETAFYERTLNTFDEVVVRSEYALDDALIGQLPAELRGRIEVLVNQMCVQNCTLCDKHIHAIEAWAHGPRQGICQPCYHRDIVGHLPSRLENNVLISNKRMDELLRMGVTRMKIGGRNAPPNKFMELFSHYVFEPTGVIGPIESSILSEIMSLGRTRRGFMPYCLPDGL